MLKKPLRYCRNLALLSVLFILALLGVSPFYIYERFNQEIPIARLQFERQGDYAFTAELTQGDLCTPRYYDITGDQFQIDAGFVKWNGLGVLLGLSPRYRLDRLSGRYSDIQLENSREHAAYDLAPEVLFDFFNENSPEGNSGWLLDTSYGSSVYLSINPALRYTVFATEDGLITRAQPRQEYTRQDGRLVIEINEACGAGDSIIDSMIVKLNNYTVSLLE